MGFLTHRWRNAMAIAAALVVTAVSAATTPAKPISMAMDLLEQPSPKTGRGARKLLLDVVRVDSRLVAVGEFGVILWSDDEGAHWQQAFSPTSVMLTALTFVDANKGWAVGHDGVILASTDGGLHWHRQFDGTGANAQVLDAARARIEITRAIKGIDAKSTHIREQAEDRLADAEAAAQAGPSRPLLGVRFVNADKGFVVGAFGQLFQTEDAGKQWRYIGDRLANGEGLHLNSISIAPQGDLYIAAEAGVVFRSTDQGQTWLRTEAGYNGQLFGVLPMVIDGKPLQIAYGFGGRLYRSTDNGLHWSRLASPLAKTIVQVVPAGDGGFLLASQDGQLALGLAGGEHFEVLDVRTTLKKTSSFTIGAGGHAVIAVGLGGVSMPKVALKDGRP